MPIELAIQWPVLLHGSCPMKLTIYGWVESSSLHWAVVTIERHEFRTAPQSTVLKSKKESRLRRW